MVALAALQVVDNILLGFSVGQVILYLFVASVPAAVVLKSWRVFGLVTLLFGFLLVGTPGSLLDASTNATPLAFSAPQFRMFGVALLLLGPLAYTVLGR